MEYVLIVMLLFILGITGFALGRREAKMEFEKRIDKESKGEIIWYYEEDGSVSFVLAIRNVDDVIFNKMISLEVADGNGPM